MAARAGAALADLEFVQFHPTALAVGTIRQPGEPPADQVPLLTEALRGEGAVLVDEDGTRFCEELAPRDVVARAIYRHLSAGHRTFLDARGLGERFPQHFPTVFARCAEAGLDPRHELIPVSPAAHYCMGGVVTDVVGRTTLPGLWAAGEVTATGLHGANRLASNSLLEGVVMGRRVGADIRRHAEVPSTLIAGGKPAVGIPREASTALEVDPSGVVAQVRQLLWDHVGLSREGIGLAAAAGALEDLAREAAVTCSRPARNAVLVARLVVSAALARRESRGAHLRLDFPDPDVEPSPRRPVTLTATTVVELPLGRAVAA
jgi:L-aspartate oxidase